MNLEPNARSTSRVERNAKRRGATRATVVVIPI